MIIWSSMIKGENLMLLYQCPANKHTSSPNCTGHMKEETEFDTQNQFFRGEFFFFIPHLVLGDFGFPSRHCKKLPFFCDSSGVSSFGPVSLWGAVAVIGRTWTLPLAGDLTESPDMFKVLELLRWRRSSLLKDNREVFYKIIQKIIFSIWFTVTTIRGSKPRINVSIYPSPDLTLTLTCYQLTVVGLGGGVSAQFLRYWY